MSFEVAPELSEITEDRMFRKFLGECSEKTERTKIWMENEADRKLEERMGNEDS